MLVARLPPEIADLGISIIRKATESMNTGCVHEIQRNKHATNTGQRLSEGTWISYTIGNMISYACQCNCLER
eukprot:scaffold22031_cov18-Prasinocladus_malaysianus.AAC.2